MPKPYKVIAGLGDPVSGGRIATSEIIASSDLSRNNQKNILSLGLELAAVSNLEDNENLTFAVDSFDTDAFIDASSTNFEINQQQGFVSLIQGGTLQAKDEALADFDNGSFINTESFDDGADGAVRKAVVSAGGITLRESFDTAVNASTTGGSQSVNTVLQREGSGCLEVQFDFSPDGADQVLTDVNFPAPLDISSEQFLRLYYRTVDLPSDDNDDVAADLTLTLNDGSAGSFSFPSVTVQDKGGFAKLEFDLSTATGVDLTDLTSLSISVDENLADQFVLNNLGAGDGNQRIEEGRDLAQSFALSQDAVCRRITLLLQRDAGVTAPLNVAIANFFGTTLGTGVIQAAEVGIGAAGRSEVTVTLDQNVQLIAGVEYKILLQSTASGNDEYFARQWTTDTEPSGFVFVNGDAVTGSDLVYALLTENPSGSILYDQLETEGPSTFQATGDFESRAFDLGQVPASLDDFSWTEAAGPDTIQVQIRFAATSALLSSTPWSANLANPETAFAGITADQWFQYRVQFTGGTTSASSAVESVILNYTVAGGTGSADVISTVENTVAAPTQFMFIWEDDKGSGTINYFISRDGKATWQAVLEADKGELKDFLLAAGTQVHVRAVMTGNAKLYGWVFATNEDFL